MGRDFGKGWIGLDLGHRSITIAQLERSRRGLRIAAACEMPRTAIPSLAPTRPGGYCEVSRQELQTARLLASGLAGKAAACVLPMSVTELTHASLPPGDPREQHAMVASEMEASWGHARRRFDFWSSLGTGPDAAASLLDVNVISIEESLAASTAEVLHIARFDCRVLDALPHAVARAVSMAVPSSLGRPLAALHLASDHALFVVSQNGAPAFTRLLRNGGMNRIVACVSESLGLLEEEAVHVLRELGLPDVGTQGEPETDIQEVLGEIVKGPLGEIADELRRTLSYLATLGPELVPDSVCALGEGAAIRNLTQHLSEKADMSLWNWSLGGEVAPPKPIELPPSLLAVGAALSTLAWES